MSCKEKVLSNEYVDLIIDYGVEVSQEQLDYCVTPIENLFQIAYVNKMQIPPLSVSQYVYRQIPKLYGLMQQDFNASPLVNSGIIQLQSPPLALTGKGVVIGFIDTGIRYNQKEFLDAIGNTRILSIWDQTIQSGTPPEGFAFGSEYTKEDINQALRSETPLAIVPSTDELGHGTKLASVAAGSNINGGEIFTGVAPEASIVVVKLKQCKQYMRDYYLIKEDEPAYAENDIMLALRYLEQFAIIFQQPLVICLGIGTNYGDHSGKSALDQYLNAVAIRRSRCVAVCGGNEGSRAHHYGGNLLENPQNSSEALLQDEVELRVGENEKGFMLELWSNPPDILQVIIRSPGGEKIEKLTLGLTQSVVYGFIFEKTKITIDSILIEESTGKELITLRFDAPTAGIWTISVVPITNVYNGAFDLWLPITNFLSSDTFFLKPNPSMTITEPAMADKVLTIAAYDDANNSLYIHSGRGYSGDGSIKPDLVAPGVNISTSLGAQTGSSMSVAITVGAIAQFLEWAIIEKNAPYVSTIEVRNYLILGATRVTQRVYPNQLWGYGQLNLAGTFRALVSV